MKRSRFIRYFLVVAIVHVVVISAILISPGCRDMFRKKPEVAIPVEFLVDVSQPEPAQPEPVVPTPAPPKPEPEKEPEPRKEPKPIERKRPKIERSTTKVTRKTKPDPEPKRKKLTEKEIRKLLDDGATPSDRTSIPDEDSRCLDIIRRKLHSAWTQPSTAAFGLSAELRIGLRGGGVVTSRTIVKSSGSATFDTSVTRAGDVVNKINGLTAGFIRRYPTVTIEFRIE